MENNGLQGFCGKTSALFIIACMRNGFSLAEVDVDPFIGSAFKLSYILMPLWCFKKKNFF